MQCILLSTQAGAPVTQVVYACKMTIWLAKIIQ